MIIISEVVHNGEVHFQVNSCFITMISILHPNEKILVRGENAHVVALKNNLEKDIAYPIEFLSFNKYYDTKKYNWGLRIIGECIQISKTLRIGRKFGNNVYVWTCLFPTGHFFLNFITFFQKSNKHVIILHGELELLKTKNRRKTENLFGIILKMGMNLSTNKNKYIVLGDNIKSNLKGLLNERILKRTFSILHPYNFKVEKSLYQTNMSSKIAVGAIGTQMLSKNSQNIYELADRFKTDILENKITFRTIGKILPELNSFKTNLVEKLYTDTFVSQEQFEAEISKLDFVIFFYDNAAYQLCASGAIFEAIRMGVLIISIENDYFRWLFNTYGEMGFLCRNLEDAELVLKEVTKGNCEEKIAFFKNNMSNFKIHNDLNNIAQNLKNLL